MAGKKSSLNFFLFTDQIASGQIVATLVGEKMSNQSNSRNWAQLLMYRQYTDYYSGRTLVGRFPEFSINSPQRKFFLYFTSLLSLYFILSKYFRYDIRYVLLSLNK